MRITSRPLRALFACVGLLALPGAAHAVSDIEFGADMDTVSTPRFTEIDFDSITTLTLTPTTPGPTAYYLSDQRPFTDFRITPLVDTNASEDLWADGHLVQTLQSAVLRLEGLAPGSYEIILLSHNPGGTLFQTTDFWLNGTPIGSIANDPGATDLFAEQTLAVNVTVAAGDVLDFRFAAAAGSPFGTLNGLLVVPEPSSVALVALGLAGLGLRSRRRVL